MRLFPKLFACLMLLVGMAHGQNTLFFQAAFNSATVSAPTFTPLSPYSGGTTTVSISAGATPATGQTIYYCVTTTTCTPSTVYSGAISFTSTENVFAYSTATGYNNSATVEWQGTFVAIKSILQSNQSADGIQHAALTNHAAGGLSCVFAFAQYQSAPPASITNTAGFTWTGWVSSTTANNHYSMFVNCATTNAYTGTDTVTTNWTSFNHGFLVFADIQYATAVDASVATSSTSYGSPSSGALAVTGPADLVVGMIASSGAGALPSGYSCLTTSCTSGDEYAIYKNFSGSPVTVTASAGSNPWDMLTVAVK